MRTKDLVLEATGGPHGLLKTTVLVKTMAKSVSKSAKSVWCAGRAMRRRLRGSAAGTRSTSRVCIAGLRTCPTRRRPTSTPALARALCVVLRKVPIQVCLLVTHALDDQANGIFFKGFVPILLGLLFGLK